MCADLGRIASHGVAVEAGAGEKPALSMPAESGLAAPIPPRVSEPAERVSRRPSDARSARISYEQPPR